MNPLVPRCAAACAIALALELGLAGCSQTPTDPTAAETAAVPVASSDLSPLQPTFGYVDKGRPDFVVCSVTSYWVTFPTSA